MQIIALDTATPQLRAPPSGSTYSAPRAIVMTPETLTGSSATSSLSIAQTWNTTGTPTAIDLNVTDTASNASSLLMNLRVGGTSRFNVTKAGSLFLANSGSNDIRGIYSTGYITSGEWRVGSTLWIQRDSAIQWDSAGQPTSNSTDLVLRRDAANTLAQRNGVNAQAFNVYNTFTDASNYERLGVTWGSNTCFITTQAAGTGSSRPITITAGGNLTLGGGNFSTLQFVSNARQLNYTPDSLTGSQAETAFSIAQTWNTTGTPTAFDLNVTDTASNAASLLMNLRTGASYRFSVNKSGVVSTAGSFRISANNDGSNQTANFSSAGVSIPSGGFFAFTNAASGFGANDTILTRDAANTLAQRNGVNAQAFNIYNTFTDASNYERGFVRWSSNRLQVGAEALGTGTQRDLDIQGTSVTVRIGTTNRWFFYASNHFGPAGDATQDIGTSSLRVRNFFQGGGYHEMAEMTAPTAPATNSVRIYAQDNGAGKTQLMALFATGAAQQIAIEP